MNVKEAPKIDVIKVSEMFNYPQPKNLEIFENYYIFNDFTAVPYMLLSSKSNEDNAASPKHYNIFFNFFYFLR